MTSTCSEKFCGHTVKSEQITEIIEVIETFPRLSRTELANTVCELFSWKRPNGKLKTVECREFLERLDEKGLLRLPVCRKQFANGGHSKTKKTETANVQPTVCVKLKALAPILLSRVENRSQRELWYEYIERYHYLGYRQPFGAQLRYFIKSGATDEILGCFQFSSPAWKMALRDSWINWSEAARKTNLQKIINNSRFLIFPWVKEIFVYPLTPTFRQELASV